MSFEGFPKETVEYLRSLREHNDREWFTAHRDSYEQYWLEPAQAFVRAAGERLESISEDLVAEPRVNASIMRINRDIRFSPDKRPYKDHLDLWFWEGDRKDAVSGLFFRLSPDALIIGAGAHGFSPERLTAFREAVMDPRLGDALEAVVREVEEAGYALGGERYKRVPRGYEGEGERARLLRFGGLFAGSEVPLPEWAFTAEVLDRCLEDWRQLAPLHRWLVTSLAGAGSGS